MVHSCIVKECKNLSNNPRCYSFSWHRLPLTQELLIELKRALDLPNEITLESKSYNHYRVCSQCMSKVPKHRKPPRNRENISFPRHRLTREFLLHTIAHDHCYSLSPDKDPIHNQSNLSSINVYGNQPLVLLPEILIPRKENFCIEMFVDDDNAIHFYTAFQTYSHFMICFNFLDDAINHLIYPGSASTDPSNITRLKTRALSPKNEFFMTLCRLRCGLLEQDLAYRFAMSQSTVSRIFTAWVNFLYYKLNEIPIWPTQSQVQSLMPQQFKLFYPNTRIIIDATEIYIQRPSDPSAQQLTFSSYKNHNTAKALAGITPSGAFSFVSPLYGGSISDRELFICSGLLDKLEIGDAIMVDKGFNIADLLESRGVTLNIPPRKNEDQLHSREIIETRRIASLRIHIERAFGRVKCFKILNNIPNNMAGLSSELFTTCALLTNFQPPLVFDKV